MSSFGAPPKLRSFEASAKPQASLKAHFNTSQFCVKRPKSIHFGAFSLTRYAKHDRNPPTRFLHPCFALLFLALLCFPISPLIFDINSSAILSANPIGRPTLVGCSLARRLSVRIWLRFESFAASASVCNFFSSFRFRFRFRLSLFASTSQNKCANTNTPTDRPTSAPANYSNGFTLCARELRSKSHSVCCARRRNLFESLAQAKI